MFFGIVLVAAALLGIIYGLKIKNKPVTIISFIVMAATVAVWIYFYNNPY